MAIQPTETTGSAMKTPVAAVPDLKAIRDKEIANLEAVQSAALADQKAKAELRVAQAVAQAEAKGAADVKKVEDQAAADITAAKSAAQAGVDSAKVIAETIPESYHYCLSENHPGAPSLQTSPLSLVRIFKSDKIVPECPACGGQVNSMPCAGPDIPPEYILELQERFGR